MECCTQEEKWKEIPKAANMFIYFSCWALKVLVVIG